jgi:hypothetical protein
MTEGASLQGVPRRASEDPRPPKGSKRVALDVPFVALHPVCGPAPFDGLRGYRQTGATGYERSRYCTATDRRSLSSSFRVRELMPRARRIRLVLGKRPCARWTPKRTTFDPLRRRPARENHSSDEVLEQQPVPWSQTTPSKLPLPPPPRRRPCPAPRASLLPGRPPTSIRPPQDHPLQRGTLRRRC